MKIKDYIHKLTDEDKVRIMFRQDKGKIEAFIVQYYALIKGRWRTIIRIDACHGYPHKHTYHLSKKEFKIRISKNNNEAFTESKESVIKYFQRIREKFLHAK